MAAASSLSIGWGVVVIVVFGVHLTTSAPFRAGSQGSVSGRLSQTAAWRARHRVPVSRCVSAAGVGFLVILFPLGSWAFLTVGLPAKDRTQTGFPRFARTSCDRGGCPLYSGDGGAHPDRSRSPASACRITATRPYTPPQPPSMRSSASRSINKGSRTSPVRSSPRLWLPDGAGALGLSPELRTPRLLAAHVEVGTGHRARA
jgi:hypothetical protein